MTLRDIGKLVHSVDSKARHYFSMATDQDYTYWEEQARLPFMADNAHDEAWSFYVHRFTRSETDSVARSLFTTLDADPRTTVIHRADYEQDSGYIHHIFECEGY